MFLHGHTLTIIFIILLQSVTGRIAGVAMRSNSSEVRTIVNLLSNIGTLSGIIYASWLFIKVSWWAPIVSLVFAAIAFAIIAGCFTLFLSITKICHPLTFQQPFLILGYKLLPFLHILLLILAIRLWL